MQNAEAEALGWPQVEHTTSEGRVMPQPPQKWAAGSRGRPHSGQKPTGGYQAPACVERRRRLPVPRRRESSSVDSIGRWAARLRASSWVIKVSFAVSRSLSQGRSRPNLIENPGANSVKFARYFDCITQTPSQSSPGAISDNTGMNSKLSSFSTMAVISST